MLESVRDRLLLNKLKRDERYAKIAFFITAVIVFVLLGNVFYLNVLLFTQKASPTSPVTSPTATAVPEPELPTPTTYPTSPAKVAAPQVVIQNPTIKDYFVPLGSGTNQTSDWADVPGAQATIDLGQYTNIKEIHFEASISVPTANQSVSVRLYNVTDKHPVWYSEVTMPGGASAYLTSPAIVWDKGSKLYQVQMKTQLKALAQLTQSRIHINLR